MIDKTVTRFGSYVWMIVVSIVLLLALAGCGGDNTGTGTATTTGGDLQMSLSTNPDPPTAGPVTFTVQVKDANGQPVDGAKVTLSAKHPNMSHAGIDGELVSQGSGRYQASGSLSMGGTWSVTMSVTKDGLPTKTQTVDLPVR